jgi:transposase-like protein
MKCPDCSSEHVCKIGKKITRKQGKKQRYQCTDCGKTFYEVVDSKEELKR